MSDETTLYLERLIPSPPEAVFKLWIKPTQLIKWWAPDGYECSVRYLETTPGGRWLVILRGSDGSAVATSGVYRIVDAPRRLVFTWAWEDENGMRGHETEVDVSFEATPGGTRLTLRQQWFESRPARDRHDTGWSASLDRLARITG